MFYRQRSVILLTLTVQLVLPTLRQTPVKLTVPTLSKPQHLVLLAVRYSAPVSVPIPF